MVDITGNNIITASQSSSSQQKVPTTTQSPTSSAAAAGASAETGGSSQIRGGIIVDISPEATRISNARAQAADKAAGETRIINARTDGAAPDARANAARIDGARTQQADATRISNARAGGEEITTSANAVRGGDVQGAGLVAGSEGGGISDLESRFLNFVDGLSDRDTSSPEAFVAAITSALSGANSEVKPGSDTDFNRLYQLGVDNQAKGQSLGRSLQEVISNNGGSEFLASFLRGELG